MTTPSDRLFSRNFSLIITGQGLSLLGNALTSVVLVLYLKQLTGSATTLGVMEFLAFLPPVIMGPLSGILVDRANRVKVLVWSYLLRGLLMMALFFVSLNYFLDPRTVLPSISGLQILSFPSIVYVVFVVSACMGIIDSVFNTALNAIIPVILAKENIQKGNGLLQSLAGVLSMIGNALGGIVFTVMGGVLAFLINGLSYFSAAMAGLCMSVDYGKGERKPALSYGSFVREMGEGFRFIWANRGLRNQTVIYTLSNLLFPMVMIALPFLVEDMLKLNGAYYGYLLSILTLSSITGAFLFGSLRTTDRQNYLVICTIFLFETALFFLISLTANVAFVFTLFALLSACMAVSRLINTALKQKVIPDRLRGRVFGTLDSLNGALAPFSFALGGVLVDLLNKNLSVLFLAIFAVYAILAAAFVLNRPIRQFYLNSEDPIRIDD